MILGGSYEALSSFLTFIFYKQVAPNGAMAILKTRQNTI